MPGADPHHQYRLQRFLDAQEDTATYERALSELRAGRKVSHWMWFVFPQIEGLGHSATARAYATSSLAEAGAYLSHPILGARLRRCAGALLEIQGASASEILGELDAIKLRSSMTLFAHAAPGEKVFQKVLDRYFNGVHDQATVRLLGPTPQLFSGAARILRAGAARILRDGIR